MRISKKDRGILDMYSDKSNSISDIRKKYKVSTGYIYRLLDKHGVPRRFGSIQEFNTETQPTYVEYMLLLLLFGISGGLIYIFVSM